MITKQYVSMWCENLVNSWLQVDFTSILNIFSEVELYYEDPFSEPGSTAKDIQGYWDEITFQKINNLQMEPIAIEGDVAIIRWYLDYEDTRTGEVFVMDGIYHVEFNKNQMCKKFTQWWVLKE